MARHPIPGRVVITGMGVVSAAGIGLDPFWKHLSDSRSAISSLDLPEAEQLRCDSAAQVSDFNPGDYFDSSLLPQLDRHSQFALLAAREALKGSSLDLSSIADAAAVIGTGCGGKETDEETYSRLYKEQRKRVHPLTIPRGMPCAAVSQVSMQLGITGPAFTVSSACASSNHAISQAYQMIASGMTPAVLTGGADAPFTFGLIKAWEAMRVLSSDTCRPFSTQRDGLVLGEGAGMFVLERLENALSRGADILAEVIGIGMSSDASHITDPSVDGAAQAMSAALSSAGVNMNDVDYINAHGTGTRANDVTESRAIRKVFEHHADNLMVSSTKSMHGHALGASGSMELVSLILGMQHGFVPPTLNYLGPSEGCDLNYVVNQGVEKSIDIALSNSFAFGGLNSVIALRRFKP